MKRTPFRSGLAILAGGLSFVGSASATDLLLNGSFETYSGGGDVFGERGTNDWVGYFSRTSSSASGWYDGPGIPASENPGAYFGWRPAADFGMWSNFTTPEDENYFLVNEMYAYALTQTVYLTNAVSESAIDTGYGGYTFSSWLASYNGDAEKPYVVLRFFDYDTVQLGSNIIFDRTTNTYAVSFADGYPTNPPPANLIDNHEWVKYSTAGIIPTGARRATIYVTRSPKAGRDFSPDTYVDLVKLDITDGTLGPPSLFSGPTPVAQTVLVGNAASINIANANGLPPLSYQWRHNGTNLPGMTDQQLSLPVVLPSEAGSYDVVVTNSLGSITSPPPAAVISVINPPVFVTGQWDFSKSNLVATCGQDLQYFNAAVQSGTTFGTTAGFGIPNINGLPATVMHMTPGVGSWGGYKMFHGAAPNGGGAYVNKYTLVFDIYYPTSGSSANYGSFLQTATGNGNDGDFFVHPTGGIGINSVYEGYVALDAWHRIAFAFSLTPGGTGSTLTKFIDGVKAGEQALGGAGVIDGGFSLDPFALLLADDSGDTREAYISSIQFSNGRRPDGFLAALGGATASKIPGCATAAVEGGNVVIRWPGDVPLEGADSLSGPWTTVSTSSPYTVVAPKKFFRPKIP